MGWVTDKDLQHRVPASLVRCSASPRRRARHDGLILAEQQGARVQGAARVGRSADSVEISIELIRGKPRSALMRENVKLHVSPSPWRSSTPRAINQPSHRPSLGSGREAATRHVTAFHRLSLDRRSAAGSEGRIVGGHLAELGRTTRRSALGGEPREGGQLPVQGGRDGRRIGAGRERKGHHDDTSARRSG